jgi:hypothetical protein
MELVPTVTSLLALSVSVFTFWWSNLREKRAFHLVCLQKLAPFETIDFALVNGGKYDLLVTSLHLYFEGTEKGARFYPAVRFHGGTDGSADLIPAGKAIEFRVEFTEALTSSFAQSGKKDNPWTNLFAHYVGVELTWVDLKGKTYTARVLHSRLGLDANGKIMGRGPVTKQNASFNLFWAAT